LAIEQPRPPAQPAMTPAGSVAVNAATTSSNATRQQLAEESLAYQRKYQTLDAARAYDAGYRERRSRTTLREMEILRTFLSRYDGPMTILDAPSGGGRLSATLAEYAQAIVEMDIAQGQLLHGRANRIDATRQTWVRGSALAIPLPDASVDAAVCIRLSHHLYCAEERERLLAELLRVATRFVVFHYVDGHSPRYLLRAWRGFVTGRRRRKNWMTYRELDSAARRHGGRIVASVPLRPLQPHRYALIERLDAH
jgi:ubiquinone/menaquinone biosynthesis C-methylase UbiE